jgi:hypothetical protein
MFAFYWYMTQQANSLDYPRNLSFHLGFEKSSSSSPCPINLMLNAEASIRAACIVLKLGGWRYEVRLSLA